MTNAQWLRSQKIKLFSQTMLFRLHIAQNNSWSKPEVDSGRCTADKKSKEMELQKQ